MQLSLRPSGVEGVPLFSILARRSPIEANEESIELAESLIDKRSTRFDISAFKDGYKVALKEFVNAKVNHLPIPIDEAPAAPRGEVISLMDALKKSIGAETNTARQPKRSSTSEKDASRQKPTLVKAPAKLARRKSAYVFRESLSDVPAPMKIKAQNELIG